MHRPLQKSDSRVLALLNPAAGGGRAGRRVEAVLSELRSIFPDLEITATVGPGHATELTRQAWQREIHSFIIIGGDGTAFEAINGLLPLSGDARPTLGYVPVGTGNSFARDLGLTDLGRAITALRSGRRRAVDIIRIEHEAGILYALNLFSLGFAAMAGAIANRHFKALGATGYVAAVLVALAKLENAATPLQLDESGWDHRPAALLCFSNSRTIAGTMNIAPCADPSDGFMEVIRVGAISRARLFGTFPRIFNGTHTMARGVELKRAKTAALGLHAPIDCLIDGEIVCCRPHTLTLLPGVLDVLS